MERLDIPAIRELRTIMDERGIPYQNGKIISLIALPNTREMVEWLKANPKVSEMEMLDKAQEIGEPDM